MTIYMVASSDWEKDEHFPSEQAARKRGAELRRNGESFFISRLVFRPTKANIIKMLNLEGYADEYEVIAEYEPPKSEG